MVPLPPPHLVTALCFAVAAVPVRPDTPWLACAGVLMLLGGGLPRPAGASLVALGLPLAAHGGGLPLGLWALSLQWTRSRLTALPLLGLAWYLWWQGPHGLPPQMLAVGLVLTAGSLWRRARTPEAAAWLAPDPPPPALVPRHLAAEALRMTRAWLEASPPGAEDGPAARTHRTARQVLRLQQDVVDVLEGSVPPGPTTDRTATSLREVLEDALADHGSSQPPLDIMMAFPPTADDHLLLDRGSCTRLVDTTLRVMARHGRGRALHLRVLPTPDALLLRCTWTGRAAPDAPPLNHDGAPEDEHLVRIHARAAGVLVRDVALTQPRPVVALAFPWQCWWHAPEQPAHPVRVWVQAQDADSSLGVRLDLERLGHVRVMDPADAQLTISVMPATAAAVETWITALARAGAPAPYLLITPPPTAGPTAESPGLPGVLFLRRPWRLQDLRDAIDGTRPAVQQAHNRPGTPGPQREPDV